MRAAFMQHAQQDMYIHVCICCVVNIILESINFLQVCLIEKK